MGLFLESLPFYYSSTLPCTLPDFLPSFLLPSFFLPTFLSFILSFIHSFFLSFFLSFFRAFTPFTFLPLWSCPLDSTYTGGYMSTKGSTGLSTNDPKPRRNLDVRLDISAAEKVRTVDVHITGMNTLGIDRLCLVFV